MQFCYRLLSWFIGSHIRHNATRVGKSGVVQVDKEEDIPYWALSAMTCLANWPNSTEAGTS